jgi:hypothetical protein
MMATMARVPAKTRTDQCRERDKLILTFLLSANRLNEDSARVERARTPEFREEARLILEQTQRKCRILQGLIVMHCLTHKC